MIVFSNVNKWYGDYRALTDESHLIYLGVIGLLVYVLLFGTVAGGARRWIALPLFNLQPSEFAKLAIVIFLAGYLDDKKVMLSVPQKKVKSTCSNVSGSMARMKVISSPTWSNWP